MRNNYIYWILVLFFSLSNAQNTKRISGKIVVNDGNPSGVLVLNLVTEKEVISDINGNFVIEAKTDDLIVFQSGTLEYLRKSIDDDDYSKGFIQVKMIPKINQLDEVKIFNYSRLNAVGLGILTKPAKSYSNAERKLKTATSLDPNFTVGTMAGVGLSLDPLLNAITGRTKMLKKFVAIEKVQIRVKKLENWFTDEYFIQTLKIPEHLVKGFLFYAAEDPKIIEALNLKNKFLVTFAFVEVAKSYKEFQK